MITSTCFWLEINDSVEIGIVGSEIYCNKEKADIDIPMCDLASIWICLTIFLDLGIV